LTRRLVEQDVDSGARNWPTRTKHRAFEHVNIQILLQK
jgi:hypothetical protein